MFSTLRDYCRWNLDHKVKECLDAHPDILITDENGACLRLAISHKSPKMLEALLKHFKNSLPTNGQSREYTIAMNKMFSIFEDYIDFEDLSVEIKNVLQKYLPSVVRKCLVEASENGDSETIRELYPNFKAAAKDLLSAAVEQEQDEVIETIASMAETDKQKAMIFRNAADMYSKYDKSEKTIALYKKSIDACSDYLTSHLHYANYLQRQFCNDINFDVEKTQEAESCYLKAIDINPAYSSTHKNLGNLYKAWSQYDLIRSKDLAQQAVYSYIQAIECKGGLHYHSVYSDIGGLIHNFDDAELLAISSSINDSKLRDMLAPTTHVDRDSASQESSHATVERDFIYEEDASDDDEIEISLENLSLDCTGVDSNYVS
jgi:tetratricopeptide (TPR) repeat protein